MPTDEERWAEAERSAFEPDRDRRREHRTLVGALIVGVLVAAVAVALRAGLSPDVAVPASGTPPPLLFRVGVGVLGLGLLVAVVGVVRAFGTRRLLPDWSRADGALTARERREARRMIRDGRHGDPPRTALLVAIAEQDRRLAAGLRPVLVGAGVAVIGVLLALGDLLLVDLLMLLSAVLLVVAAIRLHRVAGAANRFLGY